MTQGVEETVAVVELLGSSVGPWPTGWVFADPAEVTVWLRAADGGDFVALDASSFTVTGSETLINGGAVELAADLVPDAGWAVGAGLALVRLTPKDQASALTFSEGFTPELVEAILNRTARQVQEVDERAGRGLAAPFGETIGALPPASIRAGSVQAYDEAGDPDNSKSYEQLVADVALTADLPAAAYAAVVAAGAAQVANVTAEGVEQVAAITAAIGTAVNDVQAEGEAQVAAIEAAGEANIGAYFATDAAGLAAVGTDAYFGVQQAYGKGIDWKIDNAGVALFKGFGAGPLGANIRQIRMMQMSPLLCTQFPPGWEVWWAMDAELVDRAYIPYRTPSFDQGPYRRPLNTFGIGDLRDESTGNPAITPNNANGPCGPLTAALVNFNATASVLGITNTETFKPQNGDAVKMRVTWATTGGVGTKNIRMGQAGTVNVNYKVCAVPDAAGTDFTDPNNAAIAFTFAFTFDTAKQTGLWIDAAGDACNAYVGSIELIRADSDFPPLASRKWGGFVSRGTAARGGIVLDSDKCFTNSGLSDPGLIDFPPEWPAATDYSQGKTEVVLGEFVGGAGGSAYAAMSCEDFNNDLVPATSSNTFGVMFNNTTEEGQYAPFPNYNLGRHGANGKGLGLQAWWNRVGPTKQDYGVGGAILYELSLAVAGWQGRASRIGSYNGTRDITQVLTTNKMRIAAKARRRGRATNDELAQVITALYEQAIIANIPVGGQIDPVGLIGDSNDSRTFGAGTSTWPVRITQGGAMGAGRLNLLLRNEAIGGKGLYTSTGGIAAFTRNTTDGFLYMLERLKPFFEQWLETAERLGVNVRPGCTLRGYTNDYQHIALDPARVVSEYASLLYDAILALGVDLLMMSPLVSGARFPANTLRTPLIAGQTAFAAAHVGRVWFRNPTTGAWDLTAQAANFEPDLVHLLQATGDVSATTEYVGLVNAWRDQRG